MTETETETETGIGTEIGGATTEIETAETETGTEETEVTETGTGTGTETGTETETDAAIERMAAPALGMRAAARRVAETTAVTAGDGAERLLHQTVVAGATSWTVLADLWSAVAGNLHGTNRRLSPNVAMLRLVATPRQGTPRHRHLG